MRSCTKTGAMQIEELSAPRYTGRRVLRPRLMKPPSRAKTSTVTANSNGPSTVLRVSPLVDRKKTTAKIT